MAVLNARKTKTAEHYVQRALGSPRFGVDVRNVVCDGGDRAREDILTQCRKAVNAFIGGSATDWDDDEISDEEREKGPEGVMCYLIFKPAGAPKSIIRDAIEHVRQYRWLSVVLLTGDPTTLVRVGAAVALLPPLTLPADDPRIAVREVAEVRLMRRLVAVTRDTPPAPALTALLSAVKGHAGGLPRTPARS